MPGIARLLTHRWKPLFVILIAGAFMSACASSGSTAAATTTTPATTAGSAGSSAVVKVMTGPAGSYLTDGSGRTLYLYVPDGTNTTSTCAGACATAWPAFTTTGTATAGAGATAAVSTAMQSNGTNQVVYNGHLLYYFVKDTAPGDMLGQGVQKIWWLVSPSGDAIQTAAPSASSTGSSSAWS